jgi:type I site-specific restriction-modification system R (restriction) subunit
MVTGETRGIPYLGCELEREHKSTNNREDLLEALETFKKLLAEKDVLRHEIRDSIYDWTKDWNTISEERIRQLQQKLKEKTAREPA